jgi:hypothetical protein
MKRHYYIGDDLEDLASAERHLKAAGISTPQIHVLSNDDAGVELIHLHEVEAVLKKDVVHGTRLGAVVGIACGAIVLSLACASGLTATYTWVPAIFLALIILGFCTWEGGLIGIQNPHINFRRFQSELQQGRHILFVDVQPAKIESLQWAMRKHPRIIAAGEGDSTPGWIIDIQQKWTRFMQVAP